MNNNVVDKTSFFLFLMFVLGSSSITAIEYWGDYFEKFSAFVSSILTFLIISLLLAKSKKLDFFPKKQVTYIVFLYFFWFFIEQGYPLYVYKEQTLPDGHFFILSIQLAFNAFVAKVLLND